MTYPPGPDHFHAGGPPDLPDDIDPVGVPGERSGPETFVLLLGLLVALLALIATMGWIVYHHIQGP
jgi:hypothetical protein